MQINFTSVMADDQEKGHEGPESIELVLEFSMKLRSIGNPGVRTLGKNPWRPITVGIPGILRC